MPLSTRSITKTVLRFEHDYPLEQIHDTFDPIQKTFQTSQVYLPTWRFVLYQRYIGQYRPNNLVGQLINQGPLHCPLPAEEIASILPIPMNLKQSAFAIFNQESRQILKITVYFTTGTILIQGNACHEWVDEEFQILRSIVHTLSINNFTTNNDGDILYALDTCVTLPAQTGANVNPTVEPASAVLQTEESVDSAPVAIQTEEPMNSASAVLQTEDPVDSTPAALQTENPVDSAPAALQTEDPVVSASVALQTEDPVDSSPAAPHTEDTVDSAPIVLQTEDPVDSTSFALQTEDPVNSASVALQTEDHVDSSPAALQTEDPVDSASVALQTEDTVDSAPAAFQTKDPVDSSLAAFQTEDPVDSALAAFQTEDTVDSSPAALQTEDTVDSSPAALQTEDTVDSAPAVLQTKDPVNSSPAALQTEVPVDSALAVLQTTDPVNSSLAAQTEDPADSVPVALQTEDPVDSAPAALQTEDPVDSAPAALQTEDPVDSAPAALQTEDPVNSAPVALQTEDPVQPSSVINQTGESIDPIADTSETSRPTNTNFDHFTASILQQFEIFKTQVSRTQRVYNEERDSRIADLEQKCQNQDSIILALQRKCQSLEQSLKDLKQKTKQCGIQPEIQNAMVKKTKEPNLSVFAENMQVQLPSVSDKPVPGNNEHSISQNITPKPIQHPKSDHSNTTRSLRLPPDSSNVIIGDSNLKDINMKRLNPSGKTQVRTYRGTTVTELTNILYDTQPNHSIQKVVVHVGSNDVTSFNHHSEVNISHEYNDLFSAAATTFPSAEIALSAIPPQKPWKNSAVCERINREIKAVCNERQATFLPHAALWEKKNNKLDPLLLSDKVHFSNKGLGLFLREVKQFFSDEGDRYSPNPHQSNFQSTARRNVVRVRNNVNASNNNSQIYRNDKKQKQATEREKENTHQIKSLHSECHLPQESRDPPFSTSAPRFQTISSFRNPEVNMKTDWNQSRDQFESLPREHSPSQESRAPPFFSPAQPFQAFPPFFPYPMSPLCGPQFPRQMLPPWFNWPNPYMKI